MSEIKISHHTCEPTSLPWAEEDERKGTHSPPSSCRSPGYLFSCSRKSFVC